MATFALIQLRAALDGANASASPSDRLAVGAPAPAITGLTLDGAPFDLGSLRGRPVVVNFWGPGCVPCRDEFPLFKAKLQEYGGDDLAIVGILMFDAPAPARDFIVQYGATWPTVDDPAGAIRAAYRVALRPQTYFIDRGGIVRSIQFGQLTQLEFERQYALISGGAAAPTSGSTAGASAGPTSGP